MSGSSVIDDTNTSGLFNDSVPAGNRFVALYTELDKRDSDNLWQRQRLAYSSDGGFNYELYPEPVLDIGQKEFRDPKVFKHNDGRWIMVGVNSVIIKFTEDSNDTFVSLLFLLVNIRSFGTNLKISLNGLT